MVLITPIFGCTVSRRIWSICPVPKNEDPSPKNLILKKAKRAEKAGCRIFC
jgi:hypothetical protein